MNDTLLKYEEKLNLSFRELYGAYGYLPFRMSRFEEYDLYVSNKSFLVSDSVITFTDTDGKLLALKPDVTLSIVKNCRPTAGAVEKLYYDENVFRVSQGTHAFREIRQVGLECIGALDTVALKAFNTPSNALILSIGFDSEHIFNKHSHRTNTTPAYEITLTALIVRQFGRVIFKHGSHIVK